MAFVGSMSGRLYEPSQLLAQAGEGSVHFVKGNSTKLLKIFDHSPSSEAIAKLELLTSWPNQPATIAFPIETVADLSQQVVGFIQPYFANATPLTRLMDTASRQSLRLPDDLAYRVRICRLLAEAFSRLHAIHLVMGDVSDSNFLIGRDWLGRLTTAYIIDSNSFHVAVRTNKGNECYPSGVATEEYAAPETQPTDWSTSHRTIYSDSFGLAVLSWKLIFNGAHPFSVVTPRNQDVPPLGQRIEKRQFPIQPGTPLPPGWSPPPLDPSLSVLPAKVRDNFFAAFSKEDPRDRPLVDDWQQCLHDWEQEITPSLPVQVLVRLQAKVLPKLSWGHLSFPRVSRPRLIALAAALVIWLVYTNFFSASSPPTAGSSHQPNYGRPRAADKSDKRATSIDPELFPHFPWDSPGKD